MPYRVLGKLPRCVGIAAFLWFAMPTVSWAQPVFGTPTAASSCASCAPACQSHHCPPAYKYCYEGPPHICWHRGCPHPICDPCTLPHWGYYETCWSPYPFPPNWGHCLAPPPAAFVQLNPLIHPQLPAQRSPGALPTPGSAYPPPPTPPMGSFFPPPASPPGGLIPPPALPPMPNSPLEELPLPRRELPR